MHVCMYVCTKKPAAPCTASASSLVERSRFLKKSVSTAKNGKNGPSDAEDLMPPVIYGVGLTILLIEAHGGGAVKNARCGIVRSYQKGYHHHLLMFAVHARMQEEGNKTFVRCTHARRRRRRSLF